MIENHLSEIMGRQRINVSELARRAGLTRNTVAKLYRDEARQIDLRVLDRVCAALGVGVGEILVRLPGEPGEQGR